MSGAKTASWILRVAIAGEFIGHGVFALQGKAGWFKYFNAVGMTDVKTITTLLLLVGIVDVILAVLILIKPIPALVLWMAVWGLWTAMIRWPVVERWANWGAPLALLYLMGVPKKMKDWFV